MTDMFDQASELEMAQREAAIRAARAALAKGPSHTECEECSAAIPEARQQAVPGVTLCVCCQGAKERLAWGRQ